MRYLFSSMSETLYSRKAHDCKIPARWVIYSQHTREWCWNRLLKKYANAIPKPSFQLRRAHFMYLESHPSECNEVTFNRTKTRYCFGLPHVREQWAHQQKLEDVTRLPHFFKCNDSKGSGLCQPSTQVKETELYLVIIIRNPFLQ